MLFACIVVVLAGLGGAVWLAVIAALYALRWTKAEKGTHRVPREARAAEAPPVQRRAGERAAADPTLERLDRLVAQARPHLPDELIVPLYSVRCSIAQALPWLAEAPAHEADLYTVRETVRRYLPDTLGHYLALPPAWRTRHAVKDGKTARQLLAEQLALIDEEMREIASKAPARDVQALLANGRFLEARFGRPEFASGTGH
jgi:hypothetical protein